MECNRILIIDDNPEIHKDFQKILRGKERSRIDELSAIIMGDQGVNEGRFSFPTFHLDSAYQGDEGLRCVQHAINNQTPYALAFVDVRMPPGWDGIYTVEQLWKVDPDLQVVICTAYADHSFEDMYQKLHASDNILILKKPFDIVEIRLLASTLTKKWALSKEAAKRIYTQRTEIEYHLQKSEFLYNLSQLSHSEFRTEQAYRAYLEGVCDLNQWLIGHINVLVNTPQNETHQAIQPLCSSGIIYFADHEQFSEKIKEQVARMYLESCSNLALQAFTMNEICWENLDATNELCTIKFLNTAKLHGFAVPINIGNKLVAVAEFYSDESIVVDSKLSNFMSTATNQLTSLLEKRENEKKLQKNYVELKKLYEELQRTQSQLVQHSKLVAIGQLAAGVAHEINNPIAFVTSNIHSLKSYLAIYKDIFAEIDACISSNDIGIKVPELLNQINHLKHNKNLRFVIEDSNALINECIEGLERVKVIVYDLKTFSHADEGEMQKVDINKCIDITLQMIRNELKYKCTIHNDYQELPLITCNPRQLNQVFLNLLVNAAQAIPEKGDITIRTRKVGTMVQIDIEDTGEGITAENLAKLFDPFFTTKPVGTGTGLGLSISFNIIQKHQGTIDVMSTVGKGTTFTICLPVELADGQASRDDK